MNKYLCQAINDNPADIYLLYHAPRYDRLLELLQTHYLGEGAILDVGRSPFSEIAHQTLGESIDTLGFEADKETETGFNYHFDLNDAQNRNQWRTDLPAYDIIIFSEVIEHLHTSPARVLAFLKSLLKPDGIIIIQTPNAVALHKRLKMLVGRNPYHLISENVDNPKHFREYTKTELARYCRETGFKIDQMAVENYFDYRYRDYIAGRSFRAMIYGFVNWIYRVLPSSVRPGLCFVVRADRTN